MQSSLDTLVSDLILRSDRGVSHWAHAQAWAVETLGMRTEIEDQTSQTIRLRVALSLCPAEALEHRRSDRISRLERITRHLSKEALVPPELVTQIARSIDETLDDWQTKRVDVANFRTLLLERDGNRCKCCHVVMSDDASTAVTFIKRDSYKLAWASPERAFQANVDHIVPVSKFGTNDISNLRLLCRFCNEGKGDDGPLLLKHELLNATKLPTNVATPDANLVAYSGRLVYRALARSHNKCSICEKQDIELSIRRIVDSGVSVLSNLTATCTDCAGY